MLLTLLIPVFSQVKSANTVVSLPTNFNKTVINDYLIAYYKINPKGQQLAIFLKDDKVLKEKTLVTNSEYEIMNYCYSIHCNQALVATNDLTNDKYMLLLKTQEFKKLVADLNISFAQVTVVGNDAYWTY